MSNEQTVLGGVWWYLDLARKATEAGLVMEIEAAHGCPDEDAMELIVLRHVEQYVSQGVYDTKVYVFGTLNDVAQWLTGYMAAQSYASYMLSHNNDVEG